MTTGTERNYIQKILVIITFVMMISCRLFAAQLTALSVRGLQLPITYGFCYGFATACFCQITFLVVFDPYSLASRSAGAPEAGSGVDSGHGCVSFAGGVG